MRAHIDKVQQQKCSARKVVQSGEDAEDALSL